MKVKMMLKYVGLSVVMGVSSVFGGDTFESYHAGHEAQFYSFLCEGVRAEMDDKKQFMFYAFGDDILEQTAKYIDAIHYLAEVEKALKRENSELLTKEQKDKISYEVELAMKFVVFVINGLGEYGDSIQGMFSIVHNNLSLQPVSIEGMSSAELWTSVQQARKVNENYIRLFTDTASHLKSLAEKK